MNLISFSVYGPAPRYWHGALRNAVIAAESWPGWVCRFYCDQRNRTTDALEAMPNCQVCYRHDPRPGVPMLWRFNAASDPNAAHIIFRDADSRLSARELLAVNHWLKLDADYFIIRDHPAHLQPFIRGGLWGVKSGFLPDISEQIDLWLFRRTGFTPRGVDEAFLNEVIKPNLTPSNTYIADALPNDTTSFIGQSFNEHDHPLN